MGTSGLQVIFKDYTVVVQMPVPQHGHASGSLSLIRSSLQLDVIP